MSENAVWEGTRKPFLWTTGIATEVETLVWSVTGPRKLLAWEEEKSLTAPLIDIHSTWSGSMSIMYVTLSGHDLHNDQ